MRISRPTLLAILLATLASAANAAPYLVRGQVVSADGALPGAEVRLLAKEKGDADNRVREIRADVDADGRFEIAVDLDELDRDAARWLLEVSAPKLARRILEIPPLGHKARAGATEELGGIRLSPGATVHGWTVTGKTPLAEVRASLWPTGSETSRPWTATAGPDGAFSIRDVPPGEYDAVFDRPGFAPRRLERLRIPAAAVGDRARGPIPPRRHAAPARQAVLVQHRQRGLPLAPP